MKGIYLIKSPSDKFYIGQSLNIDRRFWQYSKLKINGQRKLLASFQKHGVENHVFSVAQELPNDCSKEVLTNYEQFYLDQYNEAGIPLLNIKMTAGIHGGHSEETKRLIGLGHKGKTISQEQRENQSKRLMGKPSPRKGTTHTDEAKAKIKAKRALQTNVVGRSKGNTPWNKGMKGQYNVKGHPVSEEAKEKIRQKLLGSKLSSETIAKRSASVRARTEKKKDWSEESKRKQSERVKLFNINKKLNGL